MEPDEKRRRIPDSIYSGIFSAVIAGTVAIASSQLTLRAQQEHDEARWRLEQEVRAAERDHAEKLRWLERAIEAVGDARMQVIELNAGLEGVAVQQAEYLETRLVALRDHKPTPEPDPEMLRALDKLIVAEKRLELTVYRVLPVANSTELREALQALSESEKPGSVIPILSTLAADSKDLLNTDLKRLRGLIAEKKGLMALHARLDRALGAVAQDLNQRLVSAERAKALAKTARAVPADTSLK
jgi:hypothetical protein